MGNIGDFALRLSQVVLNPLILLLFAIALVVFLWGVFQYVKGSDSDTARDTGRRHIIWGIVGIFIMVAVYGILQVLITTVFG